MGPLLPAAVGAAGSILSSVFSNTGRRKSQDRANKHNVNFWNMQNAYNHPTEQMKRLREAGLNPNLIYGSSSGGASGQAEKIAPSKAPDYNIESPIGDVQKFADVGQKNATIDNLRAQNTLIKQETILKAAQTGEIGVKTARGSFDLGLATELRNISLQAAQANLRFTEQGTIQRGLDNTIKSQSVKAIVKDLFYRGESARQNLKGKKLINELRILERDLRKIGIERNDPWYFRVLGRNTQILKQIIKK